MKTWSWQPLASAIAMVVCLGLIAVSSDAQPLRSHVPKRRSPIGDGSQKGGETVAEPCADLDGDGRIEITGSYEWAGPDKWGWYVQVRDAETGTLKREIADARLLELVDFRGDGVPWLVVERAGAKPPINRPTPIPCPCARPGSDFIANLLSRIPSETGDVGQVSSSISVISLSRGVSASETRLGFYHLMSELRSEQTVSESACPKGFATGMLKDSVVRSEVLKIVEGGNGLPQLVGTNRYTGRRDTFGLSAHGVVESLGESFDPN